MSGVLAALVAGFEKHGDNVQTQLATSFAETTSWPHMVVVIGSDHVLHKQILDAYTRIGKHALLTDVGYLDKNQIRLALDGWHSKWMFETNYEPKRAEALLDRLGLDVLPEIDPNEYQCLTYIGLEQQFVNWHQLGNGLEFDIKHVRDTLAHTPRRFHTLYWRVFMRANRPGWVPMRVSVVDNHGIPFLHILEDSHVVVTFGNPRAITASLMGIPVIDISGMSPLQGVIDDDLSHVVTPRTFNQDQRLQALARIANHQFDLDEISSGAAIDTLVPHTIKRLEGGNLNVIDQYKLMHEHPRRYRGSMPKLFITEIGELVHTHKCSSLLDYGSGKGRQYDEQLAHEKWGGPRPICYDPGWPPLATKPTGTFDGVICTDVMEHIPTEDVPMVLEEIIRYANKFVFFCIFTDPATKNLPDGRNCHLTQKPGFWWNEQIVRAINKVHPLLTVTARHKKGTDNNTSIITDDFDKFQVVVFYRDVVSGRQLKED
jgi:hypothetical protein